MPGSETFVGKVVYSNLLSPGRPTETAPRANRSPQHRMTTRSVRYTDEQKTEALRLYRQGYSCRAAAQETGVGFRVLAKWAQAVGIIRKRSQRSPEQLRRSVVAHRAAAQAREIERQQKRQAREELLDEMRTLRRQGLTLREVGARFGYSRQTIARWLRP